MRTGHCVNARWTSSEMTSASTSTRRGLRALARSHGAKVLEVAVVMMRRWCESVGDGNRQCLHVDHSAY